jgi:hypothetical protein
LSDEAELRSAEQRELQSRPVIKNDVYRNGERVDREMIFQTTDPETALNEAEEQLLSHEKRLIKRFDR